MIDSEKLAEFTVSLDNGLSQKEIQKLFKITSKQYREFLHELSIMNKTMIPLLVSKGLIDDYIYQKSRLKYQKKWVIQKRIEIMAMGDGQAYRELFREDERLDQAKIKLECDKIIINNIKKYSSDVPIVAEKLKKLVSSKV